MAGLKIVKFEAENYKRLRVVEITPEGNMIPVGGKNAQGKSSVLDAINVALGGLDYAPLKPVREGEERSIIRLDLGEIIVTRMFTPSGSTLTLATPDGAKYGSPQQMLDRIVGEISFDPIEFMRMKPEAQTKTLRGLVKLDVDFDEHKRLDDADYEARRDVNRDAKAKAAQRDAIPILTDLPDKPVDKAALVAELADAGNFNARIDIERADREQEQQRIATQVDVASERRLKAQKLREEADALMEEAETLSTEAVKMQEALDARKDLPEPKDVQSIRQQIAEAEVINEKLAQSTDRARLDAEVKALEDQAEALTKKMAERAKARDEAIAKADMPVKGLGFADGVVAFNGIPLEQASTAEQIRISTAIAMAANPKLRVIRVKDGSLLDEDGLKIIADMATEGDFQIWLEVVGDTGGVGVVMEDGLVKGAPVPESKLPPERKKKGDDAKSESDDASKASDNASSDPNDATPQGGLL